MAAFRKLTETTTLFGAMRSAPQETLPSLTNRIARRGYHVELGAREKALLEEDHALKRFKSYKHNLKRVSKIGDILTIVVVADTLEAIVLRTCCRKRAPMNFMQW